MIHFLGGGTGEKIQTVFQVSEGGMWDRSTAIHPLRGAGRSSRRQFPFENGPRTSSSEKRNCE
jgi:hypothetical protein